MRGKRRLHIRTDPGRESCVTYRWPHSTWGACTHSLIMNPGHDGPEPDARPGLSTAPAEAPAPVDFTSRARCAFPVVGIGASAGGIDALRAFFTATTPDSGRAQPHLRNPTRLYGDPRRLPLAGSVTAFAWHSCGGQALVPDLSSQQSSQVADWDFQAGRLK